MPTARRPRPSVPRFSIRSEARAAARGGGALAYRQALVTENQRQIEAAHSYSKALTPWALGGGYLNYASEPVSELVRRNRHARREDFGLLAA
jgi:hypothetical protein